MSRKNLPWPKKCVTFKSSNKLAISKEKPKTHFANHFAAHELPTPPELERPEEFSFCNDEVVKIDEIIPKKEKVLKALKSFKNNELQNW